MGIIARVVADVYLFVFIVVRFSDVVYLFIFIARRYGVLFYDQLTYRLFLLLLFVFSKLS